MNEQHKENAMDKNEKALKDIAGFIVNIPIDDMTKAERQIAFILQSRGVVRKAHNESDNFDEYIEI
jgi:hypothetical protein